jgi:glycosyltransferase involved in cell wall biosynthesis
MTFGQVIHDAWPHKGDFWPTRPEIVLRVKKADYVVFLSDHVASALAPYAREWRIAPHPSLALYPEVRSVGRSKRKVLFIGRLLPYKGLDLLLEAWSALDLPGCELLIAGSGRLPKVTIPADVRVINRWLSDYDFELLVSESDLVVLPYREASQSGVIPLALALGKPIVATPVGGLSSQFRNGVEGLISRDLTALSLAQAIRDALLKEWRLGSTKSSNDQFVSAIVPHG